MFEKVSAQDGVEGARLELQVFRVAGQQMFVWLDRHDFCLLPGLDGCAQRAPSRADDQDPARRLRNLVQQLSPWRFRLRSCTCHVGRIVNPSGRIGNPSRRIGNPPYSGWRFGVRRRHHNLGDAALNLTEHELHALPVRVPIQDLGPPLGCDLLAQRFTGQVERNLVEQLVAVAVSGQVNAVAKEVLLAVVASLRPERDADERKPQRPRCVPPWTARCAVRLPAGCDADEIDGQDDHEDVDARTGALCEHPRPQDLEAERDEPGDERRGVQKRTQSWDQRLRFAVARFIRHAFVGSQRPPRGQNERDASRQQVQRHGHMGRGGQAKELDEKQPGYQRPDHRA